MIRIPYRLVARLLIVPFVAVLFLGSALLLLGSSHAEAPGPGTQRFSSYPLPPDPVARWLGEHAARDADREPEVAEFRPIADTFIASKPPYDQQGFGYAGALYFGSDPDMGILRTFVDFGSLQLPPGARIAKVVLALGIAGGSDDRPLPIEVAAIPCLCNEWLLNWHTQPQTVLPLFTSTVVTRGMWFYYDITPYVTFTQTREAVQTTHSVAFRIRAFPEPGAGWKGMWSREGKPEAAPRVLVAYYPDVTPPTCEIGTFPEVIYGQERIPLRVREDASGIAWVHVQEQPPGGEWRLFMGFQEAPYTLILSPHPDYRGQILRYRCRARDRAGNVSPWSTPVQGRVNDRPPRILRATFPRAVFRGSTHPNTLVVEYAFSKPEFVEAGWGSLQYRDYPDGAWYNLNFMRQVTPFPAEGRGVFTFTWYSFASTGWKQYRVRLKDLQGNRSDWVESAPIPVAEQHLQDTIFDNRGAPLRLQARVTPDEWLWFYPDDVTSTLEVYGWGSRRFTLTLGTKARVLATRTYTFTRGSYIVDYVQEEHIGIGDNAIHNGDFSRGWNGWNVKVPTALLGTDVLGHRFAKTTLSLIPSINRIPAAYSREDGSLFLWNWWHIERMDVDGKWRTQAIIPQVPDMNLFAWRVAATGTGTYYAVALDLPPRRAYLYRWQPGSRPVGPTFITNTQHIALDTDRRGRLHLLWWDAARYRLVHRVGQNGSWKTHFLPMSGHRAQDVSVVVLRDEIWAFRRSAGWACWYVSKDEGETWSHERCISFPQEMNGSLVWAFRGGERGPFLFDGTALRMWRGDRWVLLGNSPHAVLAGCPDGSVRGVTLRPHVYTVGWDAQGRELPRRLVSSRAYEAYYFSPWCGLQDYGVIGTNLLVRAWREPQQRPVLQQRVSVPVHRPTFGVVAKGHQTEGSRLQVALTPVDSSRSPVTFTFPLTEAWSYHWADVSGLAGEEVTLSVGISSTVYPVPPVTFVAFKDLQLQSHPYEGGISYAGATSDDGGVQVRLHITNARPITITGLTVRLALPPGYTLVRASAPILAPDRIGPLDIPAGGTSLLAATFRVDASAPRLAAMEATLLPTEVDLVPGNNRTRWVLVSRPSGYQYIPWVVKSAPK